MSSRRQSLTRMQRNSVVSKANTITRTKRANGVATICVGLTPLTSFPRHVQR